MGDAVITVRVLDGGELLEEARLPRYVLPDGRVGALWRGQVFAIAADGSIDIAGPFELPQACRPWGEPRPIRRWSLLEGVEEAVLLIDGDGLARDAALAALRAAGLTVHRVAPCLDPDLEADWSLRLGGVLQDPPLRARVERALGPSEALPVPPPSGERLALRLLEDQVRRLLAERAALQAELAQARAQPPKPARSEAIAQDLVRAQERIGELESALAEANLRLGALERDLEQAQAPLSEGPRPEAVSRLGVAGAPGGAMRLHQKLRAEIEAFFQAALPRLELVGDSVLTLVTDYHDRSAVYRILVEIQTGVDLHRRFKPVRSQEGWFECHVTTGQDDSGRIYVSRVADRWLVLISTKAEQSRDLGRLAALRRRTGRDG